MMGAFKSAEDMAGDMARKIEKGEWPDGFRLPPERELAAAYGLARNTVRRALDQLDDRVVRLVGRGTYVRGRSPSPGPQFLGRLKEASPSDVMEVRLIIEPHAAALAWSMPLMTVAMLGDMGYRWRDYAQHHHDRVAESVRTEHAAGAVMRQRLES